MTDFLNLVISLLGDSPNIREYSRLKWDSFRNRQHRLLW